MKQNREMRELVESREAQLLTMEAALHLKGKEIQTIYFGYAHQDGTDEFVVGGVVNELEYYRQLKEDGFPDAYGHQNRAEYWESYMTEAQLQSHRQKMLLLREDGSYTFMYCVDGSVFCCSDDDRVVYFVEA